MKFNSKGKLKINLDNAIYELFLKKFQYKLDKVNTLFFDKFQKFDESLYELNLTVEFMAENYWTLDPLMDINDLFYLKKLSCHERLDWLEEYYFSDNYKNFFEIFDQIIIYFKTDPTDQGYLNQLKNSKKLLLQDFKYFNLIISTFVSILEYKIIKKLDELNTNNYPNYKYFENASKRIDRKTKINLERLNLHSLYLVFRNFYSFGNFKNGINDSKFSRHSIQHGRYNPTRYVQTDLLKIILLLFSICENKLIN